MPETPKTAFIIVDVQKAFLDYTHWGPSRSNPTFERNAASLLRSYRSLITSNPSKHKLINIAHASLNPSAPLHPSSPGFAFQDFAKPEPGELVITKNVNSAFIGTNLESLLREHFGEDGGSGKVYIVGLTTDHCVSTTTRMASNFKIVGKDGEVVFVEDATAAWKKDGKSSFDAETVHGVHTESLREFATIGKTGDVMEEWKGWIKG